MKFGKNIGWHRGKPLTLLLSSLLIFTVIAGGTLAYLFVSSALVNNYFNKVSVTSSIVDDSSSGATKIKNTGDIDAWIRVTLVPTWEDGKGNAVNQTASLSDLSISINRADWFEKNGYYYCKTKIAPDGYTPELIYSTSVPTSSTYQMNLQILCEAIQAEPAATVNLAWPAVDASSGSLVG